MANLTESPIYESGIFQLEKSTPAVGGAPVIDAGIPSAGHANAQAQQLANRTAWLKEQVDSGGSATALASNLAIQDDTTKGAGLVGGDGTTLIEQLTLSRKLANYTALRNYTGIADRVEITQSGISGIFLRDPTDTTSLENYGTLIVSSSDVRWKREFVGASYAEWFYISGESDTTKMIQRAIDASYIAGGGVVQLLAKTYNVSVTTLTLPVMLISAGGALNPTTTLTQSCLVLRAKVSLIGAGLGATTIQAPVVERSSISLYEMDGGGLRDMTIYGGKGVTTVVSSLESNNCNMVLDNLEIGNSSSYGLGIQMGFNYNNRYSRIHVHHTGQDAIDHKARVKPSTGELPYGNSFENILVEYYGQTSATESAGMDLRGQQQVTNVVCRNFSVPGKSNIGLRLSTGVTEVNDKRIGSDKSTITNFYINSGDATDTGIVGLAVNEASFGCVTNGVIENCHTGVNQGSTVSGNGRGDYLSLNNIQVFGARGNSFQTTEDSVSIVNCKAIAAEDYFSEALNNLVIGQTVIPVPRTFVAGIVKVYKNNVLLTLTTDYTLTGTTAVNLVVAAASGDIIRVQTPGSRGANFTTNAEGRSAINNMLIGFVAKGMVTPVDGDATSLASLTQIAVNDGRGSVRTPSALNSGEVQAFGPLADYELELRSQGVAGVTARSNGTRAARFVNPASAVNWAEIQGSIAGTGVRIGAAGSDTNINVRIVPKGSTASVEIPVGNVRAFANDAAAATGGVPVGGLYRIGNAIQIRLA
jgi:hypothetical protein